MPARSVIAPTLFTREQNKIVIIISYTQGNYLNYVLQKKDTENEPSCMKDKHILSFQQLCVGDKVPFDLFENYWMLFRLVKGVCGSECYYPDVS